MVKETSLKDLPVAASPQQIKKRAKRLPSLNENDDDDAKEDEKYTSPLNARRSNADLIASALADDEDDCANDKAVTEELPQEENRKSDATNLMPPPPAPSDVNEADESTRRGRPQRAAKLKSEKNLKEPGINRKLRRPSDFDAKVKLEHEQRQSQRVQNITAADSDSAASKANESVVVIPVKTTTVEINSDDEETETADVPAVKSVPEQEKGKCSFF